MYVYIHIEVVIHIEVIVGAILLRIDIMLNWKILRLLSLKITT